MLYLTKISCKNKGKIKIFLEKKKNLLPINMQYKDRILFRTLFPCVKSIILYDFMGFNSLSL